MNHIYSRKTLLGSLAQRVQWRITKAILVAEEVTRDEAQRRTDLDCALSWALQQVSREGKEIHFPLDFIEFVRNCLRKMSAQVQLIRADSGAGDDIPSRRLSLLLDAMRDMPPLDFLVAQDLALLADSYQTFLAPMQAGASWIGDTALHFRWSSSLGAKGRIIATVVRIMQSRTCLEIGTAYGMSAAFILETLQALDRQGHLTTLEGSKSVFDLSSKILETRYGGRVTCHCGWTSDALPTVVQTLKDVDFVFHDAGHSRDDYVGDFAAILPSLKSGAVVLIDDIRWHDPTIAQEDPRCYDGWLELVNHPRVCQAVEINSEMGLLLLK